ncbi:MAG: DUF1330 domain-containing protein [Rhodospirillaceae bacterium]|jgi:hypothetical protein|nr:DUF1330 domain-containing protein [Rhodospirillaceae bacterium]MBT5240633.1 DUF1330 domain-containing protein [Rhodospirillaceae bacterium]MBT5564468.1 DUF1330 domain-containing protein [Rhodospirillaceae bacterium]
MGSVSTLFDETREIPEAVREGPFLSVFVAHNVVDPKAYEAYQAISDGKSLKPSHFGGEVMGFSKPAFRFIGPEDARAVAVIRWPNFAAFTAWRTQPVYAAEGVADLHAAAERESVYFLPCI